MIPGRFGLILGWVDSALLGEVSRFGPASFRPWVVSVQCNRIGCGRMEYGIRIEYIINDRVWFDMVKV